MVSENATPKKVDWPVFLFISAVHILAIPALFNLNWEGFAVLMILNFFTNCIGVTFGMHRLFSHRSFKVVKPIEWFAGLCATLSFQGTIGDWVGHHRMHHAGSDTPDDPHDSNKGFFFSHWGWLFYVEDKFDDPKKLKAFARDIYRDPVLAFMSTTAFMISAQVALMGVLFAIGGFNYVVWGIFARLVVCYHSTWLVNSAAHMWGYKNFEVGDKATNNWIVALLSWGEGWHNNHHAYGDSVRAGFRFWEIDITYMVIRLLKFFGLAYDLKYTMPGQAKEPAAYPAPAAGK